MSGDPRSRTPAWRKDIKAPEKKQAAQPAWKREAPKPLTKQGWSRRSKLFAGSMGLLVVSGLLFWVIFMLIPPKPACLILVGADYGDNPAIPQNALGWQTLEDLRTLDGGGG